MQDFNPNIVNTNLEHLSKCYRDIEPLEDVRVEHRFSPLRSGKHKLIGTFSSKELIDITGSADMEVYGDEE